MFKTVNRFLKNVCKMTPKVVFVLGGPGAGKGTQCQNIVQEYGFVHLSAGDLLREERSKPGSEYGDLIENYIKEGKIVPVDITCSLLERAMFNSDKGLFLIDGFPRNKDNLDGWNRRCANKVHLLFVLYFDCPLDICVERCLNRGAGGSSRVDDNADSLKKRINTFITETQPIVQYYKSLKLVKEIDASRSKEEIFEDIRISFDDIKAMGDM